MNTYQGFFSISDWWNYSSAAGDAVAGRSLAEYVLDGRAVRQVERDLSAETATRERAIGPVAAVVAQMASAADAAASGRATGNGWTPECFAGWNAKSV